MKVWDSFVEKEFTEYLGAHGVDLPRAWSRHYYAYKASKGDISTETFRDFLIAEYPIRYAAWRVRSGEK